MKCGLLWVIGLALLGLVVFIGRGPIAQATASSDPPVTYAAGWSIVGGPPGTVFSQAMDPLYTRQPGTASGTYQTRKNTTPITAGWGYWANFSGSTTVNIPAGGYWFYAVSAPPNEYVMVGNPCGNGPAWVLGADKVLRYRKGQWSHSTRLLIGDGAFAKVYEGGVVMVLAPACAQCQPSPPEPPIGFGQLPPEVDVTSFEEVETYLQGQAEKEFFYLPCQPCPPGCQPGACPSAQACDHTYVGIDEGEGSTYYIDGSRNFISISVPEGGNAAVYVYPDGEPPSLYWSDDVSEGITVLPPYTEAGPPGKTWVRLEFTPDSTGGPCTDQTWYQSSY